MSDKFTVFTHDRLWKAEMSAFRKKLFFYNSIGTDVTVYHWEKTHRFLWFGSKSDWIQREASYIEIFNVYSSAKLNDLSPNVREKRVEEGGPNQSYWQNKLFSVGTITINFGADTGNFSPGVSGAPSLRVESVRGSVAVTIGAERLTGNVETQ